MIGFHLRRCMQRYDSILADEMGSIGLTHAQFTVLAALDDAGVPVKQTDLIGPSGVDRSSLSEMLRRMQGARLVARVRKPDDARAVFVSITFPGRVALERARKAASRAENAFLQSLPVSRRAPLVKALSAAATNAVRQ